MHNLAIVGITGRMGQAMLRALGEQSSLRLSGAIASSSSGRLGRDAAAEGAPTGVPVTADFPQGIRGAQVVADFSAGTAVAGHAGTCAAEGIPLLVGATGLDAGAHEALRGAARHIAVLVAPNTSVGIGVTLGLAELAARGLGPSFDVEILEIHHRHKRDAPSGTALALGEAVAAVRGRDLSQVASSQRGAGDPRAPGSIGFAVLRGGDIVGEHTVSFIADGERIEITHRATDRMIFARGALRAAEWLTAQRPGLYGMRQVLGLEGVDAVPKRGITALSYGGGP
ncbi:MAG TPA: 4-hydroxy-tetrahydrodipicolinate reductase [Steroidobacteraceae bacterium]|nr:4-hydroxy-tetrahydrodipicolinate reductase [Steroidobacteraceae bacterium]